MKLKALLPAILIITAFLQAQVGIGAKPPQSQLDVNGNITIGFEENNPGEEGMIRWNKEKTCLECHDGNSWRCLEYKVTQSQLEDGSIKTDPDLETDAQGEKGTLSHADTFDGNNETGRNCPECEITEGLEKPLLTLTGGKNLKYNDGRGWSDGGDADINMSNIVKLNIKDGTKTSLYDPQNRTIIIDQDGRYRLAYKVQLVNHPPGGTFEPGVGSFDTAISKNNFIATPHQGQIVYRGVKVPGGITAFDSKDDQILHLKKGDKLHILFSTSGTRDMNTDTNNIYINKNRSYIVLWRL